ncbi:ExbD/TolR family protein [Agaribacterium haliotis]|uniref:ExbD/TolR family protein n=1 Tax=Agaribacterium haliotis TaxID=2013869 RepID=UPI000BB58182|nr:biopolymer transporter ExbD [Agaribacterium haliotis]
MRRLRRKRITQEAVELNITAFMNLMVILVPFLLITAVFSRMTVLDLNLPALDAAEQAESEQKFRLQVLVSKGEFLFQDGRSGLLLNRIERDEVNQNWVQFDGFVKKVKAKFPEAEDVDLLIAADVDYRSMIAVMDHLRSYSEVVAASLESYELFPNISIGDLPEAEPVTSENQSALNEG